MTTQWHVGRGGRQSGPFSTEQVREMAARGELSRGDLVWKQGMADWVDCASIEGLLPDTRSPAGDPSSPDWNPYRAPSTDVGLPALEEGRGGPVVYAGFLPRLGAAILDSVFLTLLTFVPGLAIGFGAVMLLGPNEGEVVARGLGQLVGFVLGIAYYVGLETSEKRGTWGKQIIGIQVTDMDGRRIGVGRATGRYFAKILSGCTIVGWLLPLFTEKKQALHDLIAGTLVVRK